MERVKIISGGNGVYFDSKGRRLVTMGDCTPRVGEWVYTNGKTIYGHMTGGTVPPVVDYKTDLLPLAGYGYNLYNAYFLDPSKFQTLKEKIYGYLGNSQTAYISNGYENNDHGNYKYKWYRLNDKAFIGAYDILDATIDDDENMILAERGYSYFNNYSSNWGIQWHTTPMPLENSVTTQDKNETTGKTEEHSWKINWGVCIATPWEHKSDTQEDQPLYIRKNSQIIASFALRGFLEDAKSKAISEAYKLHYGCSDYSGKEFDSYTFYTGKYGRYTVPGQSYWGNDYIDELKEVHTGSRDQPYPYVSSADATFDWIKVNKDGTYYGVFRTYAYACAFPWFSRPLSMYRYEGGKTIIKTEKYRDWLTTSAVYSAEYFVKNGQTTKIGEELNINVESGAFTAEYGASKTAESFNSLNAYKTKGLKFCNSNNDQMYYIFGLYCYAPVADRMGDKIWNTNSCGTRLYFNYDKNQPDPISNGIADGWYHCDCTDKEKIIDKDEALPIDSFILNDDYIGKISYHKTDIAAVDIYKGKGKIVTIQNPYGWYLWRIAAIKDEYFLFETNGRGRYIKDGKMDSNINVAVINTFTANKFNSKPKLLSMLNDSK